MELDSKIGEIGENTNGLKQPGVVVPKHNWKEIYQKTPKRGNETCDFLSLDSSDIRIIHVSLDRLCWLKNLGSVQNPTQTTKCALDEVGRETVLPSPKFILTPLSLHNYTQLRSTKYPTTLTSKPSVRRQTTEILSHHRQGPPRSYLAANVHPTTFEEHEDLPHPE